MRYSLTAPQCQQDMGQLSREAREGGAGDVRRGRTTGETNDGAAGIRVPVRRSQSNKRRNKIDATVVWDRKGQLFYFGRSADDLEAVAQPLDHSAGNEDASFQGV